MLSRFRMKQPTLRFKVVLTIIGAGVILVGATSIISHRYWEEQAVTAAQQQALLAAHTLRTLVEPDLRHGRLGEAQMQLSELATQSPDSRARVYDRDHVVVLSLDEEDLGPSERSRWLPPWEEIPEDGLVRFSPSRDEVLAYQRLDTPGRHVLETEYSVRALREAMRRGARLGLFLLLLGSVIALAAILFTVVEREVVEPVQRLDRLLATADDGSEPRSRDELGRIRAGVTRLLAEEQKLASKEGLVEVGQLAAEMAHEFKRPLASIHSALDLLRQEYALEENEQSILAGVGRQLDKVSETMRDMLALARPLEPVQEDVDLAQVLDAALMQLTGHPSAKNIDVNRSYSSDLPRLTGDPHRLELALANVMLNAVESMTDGGELRVQATPTGEGWVTVTIEDEGGGMEEEDVARALRPFYSTKPHGTGLGLSLVARVVDAHRGRLSLRSSPGRGTTVGIDLPVRSGSAVSKAGTQLAGRSDP